MNARENVVHITPRDFEDAEAVCHARAVGSLLNHVLTARLISELNFQTITAKPFWVHVALPPYPQCPPIPATIAKV